MKNQITFKFGAKRNAGFSMVEMIATIAAMSIIASIASPIMIGANEETKLRVLASNVDHVNGIMREAKRFGAKGTKTSEIDSAGEVTVKDVCEALTTNPQVWADSDGDGKIDSNEFAFGMDHPEGDDPYTHLIGNNLVNGYSVVLKKTNPIQLAIYQGDEEANF